MQSLDGKHIRKILQAGLDYLKPTRQKAGYNGFHGGQGSLTQIWTTGSGERSVMITRSASTKSMARRPEKLKSTVLVIAGSEDSVQCKRIIFSSP